VRRRLLAFTSVLPLLLCAGVCLLWVRSVWVNDWFRYNVLDGERGRWTGFTLVSSHGTIYFSYSPFWFADPASARRYALAAEQVGYSHERMAPKDNDLSAFDGSFLGRRGFALILPPESHDTGSDGAYAHRFWRALVPSWFLVLLLLMPAVLAIRRVGRTRARRVRGLCAACGYDLRETPERCPECGTIATTAADAR
jgi:hypothetical protein